MLSRLFRRTSSSTQTLPAALADDAGNLPLLEQLEMRQVFGAVSITNPVPNQQLSQPGAPIQINLANRYVDPGVSSVVQLNTNLGRIQLAMFGGLAPNTVQNFQRYVNDGRYNNTIFHRRVEDFVVQGGGFTLPSSATGPTTDPTRRPQPIANFGNINQENPVGNIRYTIAMARLGDSTPNTPNDDDGINTGSSQWFLNTADNRSSLDDPDINDNNRRGYSVFGQAFPGSYSVVDNLANIQDFAANGFYGLGTNEFLGELPLTNLPVGQINIIRPDMFLSVSNAFVVTGLTTEVTVSVTRPELVNATISGAGLTLTPRGAFGETEVTITATSFDGSSIQDTFTVTVSPPQLQIQLPARAVQGQNFTLRALGLPSSGVTSVAFWRDANNNGTIEPEVDDLFANDTTAADGFRALGVLPAGTNQVIMRATFAGGGTNTIVKSLTVGNAPAGTSLSVDDTTPAPNQTIELQVNGVTPAPSNIRSVQLYADSGNGAFDPTADRYLGRATYNEGTQQWVLSFNGNQLRTGVNFLFARITDTAGNVSSVLNTFVNVG